MSTDATAHRTLGADLEEEPAGLPAPDETIFRLRQSILAGQDWFEALLDAVGRWRVPQEAFEGRNYRYLVGGEAFDWLLLAERLLEEVTDLVPPAERDGLLFEGRWPRDMEAAAFEEHIGPAKHSAHLNFQYGVVVEQALQLMVEEEIHKEGHARAWGGDLRVDETMMVRVYGYPREELFARYYEDTGVLLKDRLAYNELKEFTYWLFKFRLKWQDKARVASDTRKGLAQLSRMELAVAERKRGPVEATAAGS